MPTKTAKRAPCGTLAAFRYHKERLKEDPCEACVRAKLQDVVTKHMVESCGLGDQGYFLARTKRELFETYGMAL